MFKFKNGDAEQNNIEKEQFKAPIEEKMPETEPETEPEPQKEKNVMGRIVKYVVALAVVSVLFWFGFTCQVREGSCAVILRFGAVREEITDAGLYLKLPWPFETVVTYDSRLQYLESNLLETTTKDKRNIIIQSYVVWDIEDPILYHNSVGAKGSVDAYIKDQVFSATNSTMGAYDLTNLVSLEQKEIKIDEIQNEIFTRVSKNCKENYGINVTDVSILRLSLPDINLQSVFEQMQADRQKDIDIILANARMEANKITTEADAEAAQIRADGVTKAAEIKAQTETEVAKIYAEAQSANIELYKFLKDLDTVVASVNESSVLVVKTDEYPFSVLKDYSQLMTQEGNSVVISDLNYILTQLPDNDREALISSMSTLIKESADLPLDSIKGEL